MTETSPVQGILDTLRSVELTGAEAKAIMDAARGRARLGDVTMIATESESIRLGRVVLRLKEDAAPPAGRLLIGRDYALEIDGAPVDWAFVSSVTLRLAAVEPVKFTVEYAAKS